MRKNKIIVSSIVLFIISFEKYVPYNLQISLLYTFYFILRRRYLIIKKKPILKIYPPKFMVLNVDYALKLSNYTSWKSFICLKRISPQHCILSLTTLHSRSVPLKIEFWILNKHKILRVWYLTIKSTQYDYSTIVIKCFQIPFNNQNTKISCLTMIDLSVRYTWHLYFV